MHRVSRRPSGLRRAFCAEGQTQSRAAVTFLLLVVTDTRSHSTVGRAAGRSPLNLQGRTVPQRLDLAQSGQSERVCISWSALLKTDSTHFTLALKIGSMSGFRQL